MCVCVCTCVGVCVYNYVCGYIYIYIYLCGMCACVLDGGGVEGSQYILDLSTQLFENHDFFSSGGRTVLLSIFVSDMSELF